MKKRFITYLLTCCFLSFFVESNAKHIVGGEMTYECLGVNNTTGQVTFRITFNLYRDPTDPTGAQFDNPAPIGIYRGNGTNWRYVSLRNETLESITPLDPDTGIPCLAVPTGIGVEKGVYIFELTLDILDDQSYLIAYQRCCRNNTINNILNPGDQGALYSVEITSEAQRSCDNSPIFNNFPPIVICAGEPINFDHSARDLDGIDSVAYSFCTPITAGGTAGSTSPGNPSDCDGITPSAQNCPPRFVPVNFISPYSSTYPMGGDPQVTIDSETGLITGTPAILGQFVVAVCAESYRNGQLISKIRRDFQFNVAYCDPLVTAAIEYDVALGDNTFKITSCGETEVPLTNRSTREEYIDTYDWKFGINNTDTLRYIQRDIVAVFPDTGRYKGVLIINKESPFRQCKDTAEIVIDIFPSIEADFEFEFDPCKYEPIEFMDLSMSGAAGGVTNWLWSINGVPFSNQPSPVHEIEFLGPKVITLQVSDRNACMDQDSMEFDYYPNPIELDIKPEKFVGCAPEEIFFDNLTPLLNDTYEVTWDFGNGVTAEGISPTVLFENPGEYTATITVSSQTGCTSEFNYSDYILMKEGPQAAFSYSPQDISILDNTVSFVDESTNAIDWSWIIGDDRIFMKDHTYTFRDTGYYEVIEVVRSANNCVDTAKVLIDVTPVPTYFMPDAFTPNDDALNDGFIGKGYTDGFKSFRMQIYNRWGELVYETEDPLAPWNGRIRNDGKRCPAGTYVYRVTYIGPRNENETLKGHLTLIR